MGLELLAFFLHFNQGLLLEGLLPMSNALFYSIKTKSWCYNQMPELQLRMECGIKVELSKAFFLPDIPRKEENR